MKELEDLRKEIDSIDEELVKLFVRRMDASSEVAAVKRASGISVHDPKREREILVKVAI